MSEDSYEDKEKIDDERRNEVLAKIAGYCISRNFKFDVISPKKWITLTFESRNEKQDQGIDIFIDVRPTDDVYFVVPAAYDVLIDEEIPGVLKAVNINNNYVNPARCSYSERSKKVIVDYTYPLLDGSISLEQFTRVLMFVIESAEALRDNISKAQKKIDDIEDDDETDSVGTRKRTDTKIYLSKLGAVLGEEIEEENEINSYHDDDTDDDLDDDNDLDDDDDNDEDDDDFDENEDDEDFNDLKNEFEEIGEKFLTDEDNKGEFGKTLMNFFEKVVENFENMKTEDYTEFKNDENNDEENDEKDDDKSSKNNDDTII